MRIIGIIIKVLFILAFVALVVFVYSTCAGSPLVQRIDSIGPSVEKAPYEISTHTKLYYAEQAVQNPDGTATMNKWHEPDGDKWIYHKEEITLPKLLNPRVSAR